MASLAMMTMFHSHQGKSRNTDAKLVCTTPSLSPSLSAQLGEVHSPPSFQHHSMVKNYQKAKVSQFNIGMPFLKLNATNFHYFMKPRTDLLKLYRMPSVSTIFLSTFPPTFVCLCHLFTPMSVKHSSTSRMIQTVFWEGTGTRLTFRPPTRVFRTRGTGLAMTATRSHLCVFSGLSNRLTLARMAVVAKILL